MSHSTVQFITHMKLRELHRQRARLREAYQRLAEELLAEGREARRRLLEDALAEPPTDRHAEVLGPLFDDLGPELASLVERLQTLCRAELYAPVKEPGLSSALRQVAGNVYQPA